MSAKQSFFVLADSGKCTGCKACELACFSGHLSKKALTVGNITTPVTPRLYLARGTPSATQAADSRPACMPVQCHHCEDAPCLRSCLTGAIERVDGVVVINERRCIGCRNCALACPFGAVQVYSQADLTAEAENNKSLPKLVFKCDLCREAKEPACVSACPNEALRLVDPNAELQSKRIEAVNSMDIASSAAAVAVTECTQGGI
ncbi:MAG: 4Fe-4S dicluster domain-containing protein [Termitinemataceae bacterium]|nr:MAG: 4Fe-4S dicluster domain-containing protein [Termitinemataceae bacterium]